MRAICIDASAEQSIFNIEAIVGRTYEIEDISKGSGAQNKAFHALLLEYHKSGLHSYNGNFKIFKDEIKKYLGEGFESYVYATIQNSKPRIKKATNYEDIPEYIRKDPDLKDMIMGRLKSWSDYTKKQRRETMDKLISEMRQSGVNSKKFEEIIGGMESVSKKG